jgi:hypothetical protein
MNINIGEKYIIVKKDKEQLVTIDDIYDVNGVRYYSYNYGYVGFHEGCCTIDEVRELNEFERENVKEFWLLPQQFYQSTPSY